MSKQSIGDFAEQLMQSGAIDTDVTHQTPTMQMAETVDPSIPDISKVEVPMELVREMTTCGSIGVNMAGPQADPMKDKKSSYKKKKKKEVVENYDEDPDGDMPGQRVASFKKHMARSPKKGEIPPTKLRPTKKKRKTGYREAKTTKVDNMDAINYLRGYRTAAKPGSESPKEAGTEYFKKASKLKGKTTNSNNAMESLLSKIETAINEKVNPEYIVKQNPISESFLKKVKKLKGSYGIK